MWSSWTESIKKRVCRYLLQRYLGQYLQEKISLDQLTVNLYNGTGRVTDVSLDCQALNLLAEQQNIPIEFKDGRLDVISVSVPWSSIMQDSCEIEIEGLQITVQPKKRFDNGGSMLDSMWQSMQSSMQLAEECLSLKSTDYEDDIQEPLSGLEHCAQTIDAVLSRVKMCFRDSVIRVEHSQRDINIGIALEFHIKVWRYSDELSSEIREDQKLYESSFSVKRIGIEGITLYSDLFKAQYLFQGECAEKDNTILIGKMAGLHEIKLRIKKDESMSGPQLSIDCNLGSLIAFLSPMQAHILLKLADELLNPNSATSPDEETNKPFCKEKPMDYFDFKRVEKELQDQLKPGNIGLQPQGLGLQTGGWSSPLFNDDDDEFLPMRTKAGGMLSSLNTSTLLNTSMITSTCSMQQSMSESVSSVGDRSNFYHSAIMSQQKGPSTIEKTRFSVSLASAVVNLLHDEILQISTTTNDSVLPSTVSSLKALSKLFFQTLGIFGLTISGKKDIQAIREKMNNSCSESHLRFLLAPIRLEGIQIVENSIPTSSGSISFGYCEITEYLKKDSIIFGTPNQLIDVLLFPDSSDMGYQSVKIEFRNKLYKNLASKTSLKFTLKEFISELDISIVDRISSFIYPRLPFFSNSNNQQQEQNFSPNYKQDTYNSTMSSSQRQSVYLIKVTSPNSSINFRFPIPDLRSESDLSRNPFWKRNVRDDSIILQMKDLSFSTILNSHAPVVELDINCHFASLSYKETPSSAPVLFGNVSSDDPEIDAPSLCSKGFDWPRIQVWIYPEACKNVVANESDVSDEGDSIENLLNQKNKESSPFSSRKIVHELNSQQSSAEENPLNNGESIFPGTRFEMENFIESTIKSTHYRIELNLRSVSLSLPSKQFFENVYNRISTDLLLWEPSSTTKYNLDSLSESKFHGCYPPTQQNAFSMCKSGIKLDSDSDSDEEISAFYTPCNDNNNKSKNVSDNKISMTATNRGQNEVTLRIFISKGQCSFYTPFLDVFGNHIPEKKGQITLKIEQGNLHVVSSYNGNRNLGYLCIYANKGSFFHKDLVECPEGMLPDHKNESLKKVVYPMSDEGMVTKINTDSSSSEQHLDMLSVAIKIERDSSANIKNFKVAVGIKDGLMNHKICLPNRLWFSQIVEFFDVNDALVPGYIPSTIITEFHLNLWNCGVLYNPIYLPYRCVLTVDNFSISSNIAALTNTSVLRIIAEDSAFFMSSKSQVPVSTTNTTITTQNIDLKNDFVCIMDMDFFELSVRTCRKRDSTIPRVDLSASNHILNIRTCSDSCKALLDLITYCANDGDLIDSKQIDLDEKLSTYSPLKENLPAVPLIDIDCQINNMLINQQQQQQQLGPTTNRVDVMVASAMVESKAQFSSSLEKNEDYNYHVKKSSSHMVELHFMPKDENEFPSSLFDDSELTYPTSRRMLMDPIMETSDGGTVDIHPSDDEEEFLILENDPGVGILKKSGQPEARMLIDEPIVLLENYFAPPLGKTDILRPPKHYPNAVMRYTLQEMSIVWHMFGGEDFGPGTGKPLSKFGDGGLGSSETLSENKKADHESEIDFAIDALSQNVVYSKTKCFESTWEAYDSSPKVQTKPQIQETNWRNRGGKGRNMDLLLELHLNKIKFQHEIYPETTEQASRQVIVVKNFEIIDRLRSSQFNKMLYLYTSNARPKQSHANMLFIKAAHLRSDPQLNFEECCLKISLLPIRLNIDQDAVLFLFQFLNEAFASKSDLEEEIKPPSHTPSMESLPIMTTATVNIGGSEEELQQHINLNDEDESPNLINLTCQSQSPPEGDNISLSSKADSSKSHSSPIFFRQVIFSPEVPIRLDYRGKKIDMAHGPLAGIVMGLGQLDRSEIYLKRLNHRNGILGFDKLAAYLALEWAQDIKKNQLPSLLGGVGPMYSFVQLFQGVRDLFWLPIEQYQKDGRIAKGLQKGASAFSTSTAMAALELSNRFVKAIQGVAEITFDMVSPGPSLQQQRKQSAGKKKKRIQQPSDFREGMANAYQVVREGIGETAQTIVRVASKEHEQKGYSGAVGGVLRQIPPTVVKPIILVAEATSNVLDGFRSTLEPEFKKDSEEKWKE